ncbi:glycosyltransferase [Zunongwangia sp. F260]|uniref:Glycosyltransferase n=1 Tax=Autumnicola lenta TaxID=3075593 RepID=A0ABU3CH41_9FLAO|nr:glycosyltransferase [Zunongwangia sp. F260]MDT0645310.1 glycosyltransferase [Zunongwangia sp. F260]
MLAIVIPYYKKTFFRQTLESLANQTNKRFHVYIGNDGSPENPIELVNEFREKINLTYKKFDENLGSKSLIKQWERCIDLTKNEEWITIMGDDDVYENNVVEKFYKNLEFLIKEKISVVRFATYIINEHNEVISKLFKHPVKEKATDFLIRKFKGGTRSTLSEYFFETAIVRKIKFKDFPLAWSSDTLAVVEFSNNKNIYTINDTAVHFRISALNITGGEDSVKKNEAWFKFYEYMLTIYGSKYPIELNNMLLDRLEKVQLNNKKTPLRWIKLFHLYWVFSQYSRFLLIVPKIKNSIR